VFFLVPMCLFIKVVLLVSFVVSISEYHNQVTPPINHMFFIRVRLHNLTHSKMYD